MKTKHNGCISQLNSVGISVEDAQRLRRISMTLHRWHELECGDGDSHGSWCITRGRKEMRHGQHEGGHGTNAVFIHDDDGKPFMEHHHYLHGSGEYYVTYSPMPDRENGARKRLAKIMAQYPTLTAYVQTDPRGAALYILRPGDVPKDGDVSAYYSRGLAVYK